MWGVGQRIFFLPFPSKAGNGAVVPAAVGMPRDAERPFQASVKTGTGRLRTLDPEVLKMANQVTNRILALGEDAETNSIQ